MWNWLKNQLNILMELILDGNNILNIFFKKNIPFSLLFMSLKKLKKKITFFRFPPHKSKFAHLKYPPRPGDAPTAPPTPVPTPVPPTPAPVIPQIVKKVCCKIFILFICLIV